MSLADSLDELLRQDDLIGSPLRDALEPGTERSVTASRMNAIGLEAPEELLALFEWGGWGPFVERVDWFWPATPYNLEDAIDRYRMAMRVGGITIEEFERLDVTNPASTFTGFWREDWFPILQGEPEQYALECRSHPGEAPVWRQNWHPDPEFETVEVAPSLTTFVDRVVELFRAGAYEWSATQHAIVPVEAAFERHDLAALRP